MAVRGFVGRGHGAGAAYTISSSTSQSNGAVGSTPQESDADGNKVHADVDDGARDSEGGTLSADSGLWDAGFTYVTAQTGYDLDEGPLYGAYMGGTGTLHALCR
jgi:hypothetical protein